MAKSNDEQNNVNVMNEALELGARFLRYSNCAEEIRKLIDGMAITDIIALLSAIVNSVAGCDTKLSLLIISEMANATIEVARLHGEEV